MLLAEVTFGKRQTRSIWTPMTRNSSYVLEKSAQSVVVRAEGSRGTAIERVPPAVEVYDCAPFTVDRTMLFPLALRP